MQTLFAVMNYDYEDPDWSSVEFLGLSEDECHKFIDENFEDYYQGEWDEKEDGVFNAKEMGKYWLKTELHLEVVDLEKDGCSLSESLANLLKQSNQGQKK